MIRVAVVEDDDSCARRIQAFLQRYGKEKNEELAVTRFADGCALVRDYRPVWHVLLLDIEMPKLDGMSAARQIREIDSDAVIIFITNMAKYAIKGYEVDALDFLLKPVNYFVLSIKLDKALLHLRSQSAQCLMLQEKDGLHKLPLSEICYIDVFKHRLQIHTLQGVHTAPGSLSEIENQLAGAHFARCNSGYLVNLRHITLVKADSVVVAGDELLISRRKKEEFLLAVTDYYGGEGQ